MKAMHRGISILTVVALAACGGGDQTAETDDAGQSQASEGMTGAEATTAPQSLPDTTAQAVWEYLQDVDYASSWTLWPGMGELYEGGDPHGRLLTTYVDDVALGAVQGSAATMPADAFIVKENYMPDSTLTAVTVMYKVPAYDPEHANWFWAKYTPGGAVDAAGRVESCQDCHADGNDYVLTDDFGSSSP